MTLSPGTRLGPYEVTAQIGAGGMGHVYQATDTRLGRTVAIKVSREFSARFEREARAVASLNHPNICQLYDCHAARVIAGPRASEPVKHARLHGNGTSWLTFALGGFPTLDNLRPDPRFQELRRRIGL